MMSDWPIVRLGNYCSKIGSGATPRGGASVYLEKGKICLIRSQNIYNDSFKPEGLVYITEESAEKLKNVIIEKNDVLLNITGDSVARVCLAKEEYLPARVNQHVAIVRPDPEEFDARYLRYFLASPAMQNILLTIAAVGATRNALTKNMIETLEVSKPPIDVQTKIANDLETLDNKIELNRQTNQTLEQIAQAIFKSWFVDFEPTRAKIAAKQEWAKRSAAAKESSNDTAVLNEQTEATFIERAAMAAISGKTLEELNQLSQEQREQLKTTAALFPDALIDSELGEIPEEWEIKLNGDVMDVRDGTHDSPKKSETGFPLVTSKHITSGVLKIEDAYLISEVDFEKVNKRSQVNQGDILLTMIGTVGIPYLVSQTDVNFAIKNVGLFRTSEVKELKNYFYLLLRSPFMKAYLDARIAGTTQKYLSLKTLRSLELLMPSSEVLEKFNFQVDVIMEKLFSAIAESRDLKALRDTLLPKLLSGALTIASTQTDLEKAV